MVTHLNAQEIDKLKQEWHPLLLQPQQIGFQRRSRWHFDCVIHYRIQTWRAFFYKSLRGTQAASSMRDCWWLSFAGWTLRRSPVMGWSHIEKPAPTCATLPMWKEQLVCIEQFPVNFPDFLKQKMSTAQIRCKSAALEYVVYTVFMVANSERPVDQIDRTCLNHFA